MSDPTSRKPQRTDIDAPISREDADTSSGPRSEQIPGRDFAGTSRAADQREQTDDRRGESRAHMMDDTGAGADEEDRGRPPRDES